MINRIALDDISHEEWLERRKKHVTASIVAALPAFRCHPYKTPLKLYMEKRGLEIPERDNKVMRRGRIFEPAVPKAILEEHPDLCLEEVAAYFYDDAERIGATPDYFVFGDPRGRGVLQCKTLTRDAYETDWLDGTEAPRWIVLQARFEAMMTEAAFGLIAGLTVESYDPKLALIDIPRDPAAEQEITNAIRAFWHDVDVGNEPSPIYGTDSDEIRRLMTKEQPGTVLDASGFNDLPEILAQRAVLKARMNRDKDRCQEIDDEIRFRMGTAEKIVGLPGWNVTNRTRTTAGYVVEERTARVLDIRDKRPKEERPQ